MKLPLLSVSLIAASFTSPLSAAILAEFDFATTPSFAATNTDPGVSGVTLSPTGSQGVSSTLTDPSFDGAIDNGTYLFNSGVLFVDRGGWANWGDADANATGPFTLTITASSGFDLSITSFSMTVPVNVGNFASDTIFMGFFEDGGTGSAQGAALPTQTATSTLDSPVTIAAGTSKTFNIRLNSGDASSQHTFSGMTLDGTTTAVPEPSVSLLFGMCATGFVLRRRRYSK